MKPEFTVDDLVFDFIKYEALNYVDTTMESRLDNYLALYEISLSDVDKKDLKKKALNCHVDILREGGIIFNSDISHFKSFKDYLNFIVERRNRIRKEMSERWIAGRPARRYFVDEKPKTKKEIEIADKKEVLIDVIGDYYDEKFFTKSNLKKDYILIRERDYGGEKRIGIMVKEEAYNNQYTITVRGILGGYCVSNEGTGWELGLDKDAKVFSITKTYKHSLPTKDELIDDICVYDLLERQEPTGLIIRDTCRINIYPTAKEYFNVNR